VNSTAGMDGRGEETISWSEAIPFNLFNVGNTVEGMPIPQFDHIL